MSSLQAPTFDQNQLKAVAERLKQYHAAQRVILFGSAARGQATRDSDIDPLIISPSTEKLYRRMVSVLRAVRDLSYGLPLDPIVLTPKELQIRLDRGDQFVQEILTTGVEL